MAESSTLQRPVLEAGNRLEDSGKSAQTRGSLCSTMAVSSGLCSEELDLSLLCNYCKDKVWGSLKRRIRETQQQPREQGVFTPCSHAGSAPAATATAKKQMHCAFRCCIRRVWRGGRVTRLSGEPRPTQAGRPHPGLVEEACGARPGQRLFKWQPVEVSVESPQRLVPHRDTCTMSGY